jgi:hypothetical protein
MSALNVYNSFDHVTLPKTRKHPMTLIEVNGTCKCPVEREGVIGRINQ